MLVDDYAGQPELKPFLDLVDVVKVDFRAITSTVDRVELCSALRVLKRQPHVFAEKVETCEEHKLAQLIFREAALFYLLLKCMNSAAWPPHVPIWTVTRSVVYMGTSPWIKWLMPAIIADNHCGDLKLELALLGTTRGHFFKWLASEVHWLGEDDAFMLDLFSTRSLTGVSAISGEVVGIMRQAAQTVQSVAKQSDILLNLIAEMKKS